MDFHPDAVKGPAVIESTQKGKARPGAATHPKGHSVELLISSLLRGGAIVSLGFLLIGTFLSFMDHPNDLRSPEELQRLIAPGATFPHTLTDVGSGALHLQGPALVMVGLLWLIATPVVVVAVSILMFVYQQDRDFVIITLVVLMLLMASFFLGKTEHHPTTINLDRMDRINRICGHDHPFGQSVGVGPCAYPQLGTHRGVPLPINHLLARISVGMTNSSVGAGFIPPMGRPMAI